MKQGYIYILTNKPDGTLYVGITSNLSARIYQHKQKMVAGFTKKYSLDTLVYYEIYDDIVIAIEREKEMKKWRRAEKVKHIMQSNPEWRDLYEDLI